MSIYIVLFFFVVCEISRTLLYSIISGFDLIETWTRSPACKVWKTLRLAANSDMEDTRAQFYSKWEPISKEIKVWLSCQMVFRFFELLVDIKWSAFTWAFRRSSGKRNCSIILRCSSEEKKRGLSRRIRQAQIIGSTSDWCHRNHTRILSSQLKARQHWKSTTLRFMFREG